MHNARRKPPPMAPIIITHRRMMPAPPNLGIGTSTGGPWRTHTAHIVPTAAGSIRHTMHACMHTFIAHPRTMVSSAWLLGRAPPAAPCESNQITEGE